MAQITQDLTKHLARLANVPLTQAELVQFETTLRPIVEAMNQIQALELGTQEGTARTSEEENVWRDDEVTESLPQAAALANAKRTHNGYFVVPRIIEEK